jgi:hypothetical protein
MYIQGIYKYMYIQGIHVYTAVSCEQRNDYLCDMSLAVLLSYKRIKSFYPAFLSCMSEFEHLRMPNDKDSLASKHFHARLNHLDIQGPLVICVSNYVHKNVYTRTHAHTHTHTHTQLLPKHNLSSTQTNTHIININVCLNINSC